MLSKLRYFSKSSNDTNTADLHDLQTAVSRYLQGRFAAVTLHQITGGTLGICFRADTATKPFFIKTHKDDKHSKENLLKEFDILTALYGRLFHIEGFDINIPTGQRTCIMMDWLDAAPDPILPADLRATIDACYDTLGDTSLDRVTQFSTIGDLIDDGETALVELEQSRLISTDSFAKIQPRLASLKDAVAGLRPTICHGDLSNRNIMLSSRTTVVIDWEDAFVGFAGYDYLYWLTFMDNRKYLTQSIFGYTGLDEERERDVLLTIVAIKSLISVRSNTIRPTHVPVEQRLLELLTF